jgi:peroxiredoxin
MNDEKRNGEATGRRRAVARERAARRSATAQARRKTRARLTWTLAVVAVAATLAALALATRSTVNGNATASAPGSLSASSLAALPVGPAVGDRAPDFTLPDLGGKQVSLRQFIGQPVLLHFWAVDCTTCQAEQSDYLKAIHQLGAKAPKILAVDAWGESSEYVAPYVARNHIPGSVLIDPPHSVFDGLYQGQGTPTTVYINRQGVIRQLVIGQETYGQILANAKLIGAY